MQVDFASNIEDDKRLLDRRLACVYSFLSVLLTTRDVSRERRRFFPRNVPSDEK